MRLRYEKLQAYLEPCRVRYEKLQDCEYKGIVILDRVSGGKRRRQRLRKCSAFSKS